jgi:Predicted membrane protein (DUF2339)
MSQQVLDRLDAVERQLHTLKREVDSIRASVFFAQSTVEQETPPPPPPPRPAPTVTPAPAPEPAVRVARPQVPRREVDLNALLSAKTLAWAGGAVTALGIVFLFALAVNRGWVGPGERVLLGALAALVAFAGGLELRRRFGDVHSATGAVAAGIAGGYATLLAAVGLYDLVPEPIGLVVAGMIAAAAVAVALAWDAEAIAGLGLVGAMAMPVLLLGDTSGPTRLGTAFTAIALAACATLGVARAWRRQLGVAAVLAACEALGLFVWDELSASLLILAGSVWAIYLATGIAWQLVRGGSRVGATASTFIVGSVGFAWASVAALYQGEPHAHRGFALLGCAGVYGALAAGLYRVRRDLAVLLGLLSLAVGALAAADIVSNGTLTYTWAAEAAALAVAARLLRERRFQLVALGYLALATVHAFATEAQLDRLFVPFAHPASGVPSLVALAAAAIVVAHAACFADDDAAEEGVFRFVRPAVEALREHPGRVRGSLLVLAGLVLADAGGRTTLLAAQHTWTGVEHAFANGHVAVTALWSAAALGLTLVGLLLRLRPALYAGVIWIELVAVKALAFDTHLDGHVWPWSFAAVGLATLAIAIAVEHDASKSLRGVAPAAVVIAFGFGVASAAGLLDGRAEGAAYLGLAAVAALVAAVFFGQRHRTFATTAWSTALAIAAVGDALVLDGQARTIAWAATAAALPWLAHAAGERRFQLGAIAYLVLSFGAALGEHAPPGDFVHATEHPGAGLPALVAVALALASFAAAAFPVRREPADEFDGELDRAQPSWRATGWWLAGAVGLYAASLGLLELAERVRPDGVTAAFQGGHTAVSALWGTLGLALLYLGLRRNISPLRVAGFALFGVSLGKLFLYDLARLSSITRAASFLAVGAVLLIAGFLYQHLGEGRAKEIAGNGI